MTLHGYAYYLRCVNIESNLWFNDKNEKATLLHSYILAFTHVSLLSSNRQTSNSNLISNINDVACPNLTIEIGALAHGTGPASGPHVEACAWLRNKDGRALLEHADLCARVLPRAALRVVGAKVAAVLHRRDMRVHICV